MGRFITAAGLVLVYLGASLQLIGLMSGEHPRTRDVIADVACIVVFASITALLLWRHKRNQ